MMRNILLRVLLVIKYFIPDKFFINISKILNFLFSNWVKLNFANCGQNFSIIKPFFIKGSTYINIGENFNALNNCRIECWDEYKGQVFNPILSIGNNVVMNTNVHISCINSIRIGNNVLLASNIFITDHFHGTTEKNDRLIPPVLRKLVSKGGVVIEDNVWIGENVSIMPNVVIGEGSIIGANSVVTKSFPKFSILGGVPAKQLKLNE
jgi:acetyltransferase-like isoleucine patch superfamily enzyme